MIYVVEDYALESKVDSIWSNLDVALEKLRSRPQVDAGIAAFDDPFSTVEVWVWDRTSGEYKTDYETYPPIYYRPLLNKFYTHFGDEAWYFDSAVEYRMKAVGALRDE